MVRRKPGKPEKEDASSYSRRSAVADSAWSAQDRARSGLGNAWERASYGLQKHLIWPLQDRAGTLGAPARALSFAALVLIAAGAGVAGLVLASSGGSEGGTTTRVAAAPEPVVEVKAAAVEKPAAPTLQGAAPVFEPSAKATSSETDPAKAVVKSAPPATETEDEPAPEASAAAAAAASANLTPEEAGIDGPAAGPEAIAVARDFSNAFVVYETGGLDADVRKALGATATPELSKALLRRPPRLPANVEVPRAKVLNVVAGPSRDGVYTVSVSLLRVGTTSELRLDMERLKDKEWRVTNVLG
ncbi:MAG TPA: hypothetical protein VFX85_13220 [Solirubrobacterales bacterium]|nr:hypothetical protein [Solirubrobacterales bacterium]